MNLTHKFSELVRAIKPLHGAKRAAVQRKRPHEIPDAKSLRDHLQVALELELSTIPPYLTALASIEEGTNLEVAGLVRSVMMEEMLHMILAANILNAIGGDPVLAMKGVAPEYPAILPDSDGSFQVSIQPLSIAALQTFMRIELPTPKDTHAKADGYGTIGQFYAAIMEAIVRLAKKGEIRFDHHPERQVAPSDYYNGHGKVVLVNSWGSAIAACKEIIHQGEGNDHGISEKGQVIDGIGFELAHYYRFMEISLGRRFQQGDTPASGPTGAVLPVDWTRMKNMISNPKSGWYTADDPRRKVMDECNETWWKLLQELEKGLNGKKESLQRSVPYMLLLKQRASALMNVPSGVAGTVLGPSFELPDSALHQ
ncbi:MAG: ferritin-like protein [Flavobacteriales bacterium]|jgi:hypothetical protein|nr:ferritin-like protein [Flavobacteriales bacterium]MCB0758132.1 ferritin-like protein [Flavobacteriales bacterium]